MSSHAHGAGGCVPAQGDLTPRESDMRDRLVGGAAFGDALHAGRGRATGTAGRSTTTKRFDVGRSRRRVDDVA